MPVFLKKVKNQMKSGSDAKVASFSPPKFLRRDPAEYTELLVKKRANLS